MRSRPRTLNSNGKSRARRRNDRATRERDAFSAFREFRDVVAARPDARIAIGLSQEASVFGNCRAYLAAPYVADLRTEKPGNRSLKKCRGWLELTGYPWRRMRWSACRQQTSQMLALSEQEAEIFFPRRGSLRFPDFRPTKKKLFGLRRPSRTENRSNRVMKSASA